MQRIELRNNIIAIIQELKSNEIVEILSKGQIDKNQLLNLLVNSKAGFDQAMANHDKSKIFNQFKAADVYETQFFSHLIQFISTAANNQRATLLSNNRMNMFLTFHTTILSINEILKSLLFDEKDFFNEEAINIIDAFGEETLILQIVDDDKINLTKFTKITQSLEDLLNNVYILFEKIENVNFEYYPTILLLDSGSDINITIKLPKKASKLIAQVFKQMWDRISNNHSYKYRRDLSDIEKSVTVIDKINEAGKKKVINKETAEILKRGILYNIEDIILRSTLTKQIVLESKEFSNRQLMIERSKSFLLPEKSEDTAEEEAISASTGDSK